MLKFFREPLVEFLLAGLALFLIFEFASPAGREAAGPETITVDEETLLTFIQYRMRNFDRGVAKARLAALTSAQRKGLIDDYVREEVLHREALSLGLDRDDYVIRSRLVESMRYLARSRAEAEAGEPTEEEIAAHFAAHPDQYAVAGQITFTHVYFGLDSRTMAEAMAVAGETLGELTRDNVPPLRAERYGEPFRYHLNYVDRSEAYVRAQLGPDFARTVFSADTPTGRWIGPLQSPLGAHLVYIVSRTPGRAATLEEAHDAVRDDLLRAGVNAKTQEIIDQMTARYDIRVDLPSADAEPAAAGEASE